MIRKVLGWRPRYDDLPTIVEHALRWEERLRSDKLQGDRDDIAHHDNQTEKLACAVPTATKERSLNDLSRHPLRTRPGFRARDA